METNALLFAVLKRQEIQNTVEALLNGRDRNEGYMRDFYSGPLGLSKAKFWPMFEANYAERLLGEDAQMAVSMPNFDVEA